MYMCIYIYLCTYLSNYTYICLSINTYLSILRDRERFCVRNWLTDVEVGKSKIYRVDWSAGDLGKGYSLSSKPSAIRILSSSGEVSLFVRPSLIE